MTRELTIWAITFSVVLAFTVAAWIAARGAEYQSRQRGDRRWLG